MVYRTSGLLYYGGTTKDTGVTSTNGDQINCEIDLRANKTTWIKNGIQIASIDIPEQMRNKSLYFVIITYYQGDEVKIILD
jgi:hypothetical protein